jgi:tryptophan 2,3-dioxygenase
MTTTYWDYIRVEELLRLQGGIEDDESRLSDHEVLFITVHQVFELWFKLALRELTSLRDLFARDPVPEESLCGAVKGLDRLIRIFRVASAHFDVVESLNTRDYLDFRDKLFPASGFQSAQMREIEVLLGMKDEDRLGLGAEGRYLEALKDPGGSPSPALERVRRRMRDEPTLLAAVGRWLERTPIHGSQPEEPGDGSVVDAFLEDYLGALEESLAGTRETVLAAGGADPDAVRARFDGELQQARAFLMTEDLTLRRIRASILFIESYRELPLLAWPREVLARLIEFEQGLVMFRQRHARMVERVIGRRVGTGGSSGVDYLDETATRYRVFKDLWAVRTYQLPAEDLPPLADTSFYEFAAEFE